MKKIEAGLVDVITFTPANVRYEGGLKQNGSKILRAALEDGYEIISAVPLTTNLAAGVQYVLRRVTNE